MCAVFMLVKPVREWSLRNLWMMWVCFALTIISLFPLFKYKKTYPANMICLGQKPPPLPVHSSARCAHVLSRPVPQRYSQRFRRTRWRWCALYTLPTATPTQVPSTRAAALSCTALCLFFTPHAAAVLLAWGLTCIVFLSLTVFTFQSKIDFSFMRGFLTCGANQPTPPPPRQPRLRLASTPRSTFTPTNS